MMDKPEHTCFNHKCPACAFELGEMLAKKKPNESAKFVWAVINSKNPCDIRRYAFSYEQALDQLSHVRNFNDGCGGEWVLYKLVRVKRKR